MRNVRDQYSHRIIFQGAVQDCLTFIVAFGHCYLEEPATC